MELNKTAFQKSGVSDHLFHLWVFKVWTKSNTNLKKNMADQEKVVCVVMSSYDLFYVGFKCTFACLRSETADVPVFWDTSLLYKQTLSSQILQINHA